MSAVSSLELIVGAKTQREVAQIDQLIAIYQTVPAGISPSQGSHPLREMQAISNYLKKHNPLHRRPTMGKRQGKSVP